ncbi:uncharacterized protein Z519_11892 [Cladophialophora bantiana CBS 173.52]|uniref:Uncharacterized protein n=1 Tax=Cladophialophora bantiana (strain ATCC 10958 / CBS 173.52 / CDC B-1940 / NIH 8579) TaxID=1442370 RepID=A0A0D2H2Q7_CLAB1|nr:uncharacterized protein Z519_11892 [Cladophialophora bantiana CBS 173.52]KIW87568.1 hypothetical protein Z519_11892 [Cladophialophora bantiana CBS 173.52]
MPDDKKPPDNAIPPPPMDPFPTYQTPYPRSNKDDENPFILFRRFADEQFSSFFSGFPHFFGLSSGRSDRWKKEVDDLMRQRQEWEEGFRKQVEQEWEEMRQQLEKSKMEAWKSMEEAWKQHSNESRSDAKDAPWWTRGRAAHCPALNGQEPQKNADKCPALYDEADQPRTELDAYDALPWKENGTQVSVAEASAEQPTEKKPFGSWFSALGWDGRQREKYSRNNGSNNVATEDRAPRIAGPIPPPSPYSFWAARRMQPFNNSDETIPWLLLSPYSPIYLCNPAQPRLFKVKIQDSEGVPFQISDATFFERLYTNIDEKMARRRPWADAFEDLLSLQQTGKMVERDNWNTWRTPNTWIHDMVSRGSFGPLWGFNEQGMLVKRAHGQRIPTTAEPSLKFEDRCGRWRQNHQCRRNKSAEDAGAEEEQYVPTELRSRLAHSPDANSSGAIAPDHGEAATEEGDAGDSEDSTSLYTTSPSLSYSYGSSASNDNDQDATKSVVSTLTTLRTRTLPDGSIESKLVLKSRFADGSEEIQDFGTVNSANPHALTKTEDKETQTWPQSDHAQLPKGEHAKGSQRDVFDMYRDQLRLLEDQQTKKDEYQRQQEQESEGSKRFPRRIPISTDEPEAKSEHEQLPLPTQQQQQQQEKDINGERPRRSGGGWFWN